MGRYPLYKPTGETTHELVVFVGNDLEVLLDREARGEEELEPVSGADDAVCADREALRAERHGSSAFAAPSTTLPATGVLLSAFDRRSRAQAGPGEAAMNVERGC